MRVAMIEKRIVRKMILDRIDSCKIRLKYALEDKYTVSVIDHYKGALWELKLLKDMVKRL